MITGKDKSYVVDEQHQHIINLRRAAKFEENIIHAAQCRVKQMPLPYQYLLDNTITREKEKLSKIQQLINDSINNDPELKSKRDLMVTMPGVGDKTASLILAELPEIGTLSNKTIASFVELAPQTHESGKKRNRGYIARERFYARKALYIAALVASRFDLIAKARYDNLLKKGKPKKVALVAIMHDIIVALNAMIRKMQPYRVPSVAAS